MRIEQYIQPHEEYFWQLSIDNFNDAEFVFEIPDGGTIAYAAWISQTIGLLSDQSLPPFGSLLMASAATNYEPHAALQSIKEILQSKEVKRAFPNVNLYNVRSAFVFLDKLAQLPNQFKTDEKRILVLQTIFKNCHNSTSRDSAKKIASTLLNSGNQFYNELKTNPFNESVFHKDIKTLALLNTTFPTVQSIMKAIEELPDIELEEELQAEITNQDVESKKEKDLVEALIDNNKTFYVGSLIKRLWSGLKIPLHQNQPSSQPLGGIADITNKGDFDKLLLSEFANDDLVFMTRIANNEALYIEREVPPEEDKLTRDILIDSTLKNWGNPKTIALATALAIAKHPKNCIDCQLYVIGEESVKINYQTVDQIIDGIGLLSGKLDASLGLSNYFKQENLDGEKEIFLILSEESYKIADFQKVLHDNFDSIHYIFLTSIDGGVSFYKIANKGRKLIQKVQLPLDEIWKSRTNKNQISQIDEDNHLPILLPLERNYKNIFYSDSHFFTHANGNLYHFFDNDIEKGFRKIASNVPFKSKSNMYKNKRGEMTVVGIDSLNKTLALYNLKTKKEVSFPLPTGIEVSQLVIFSQDNRIWLFDKKEKKTWQVLDGGKVELSSNTSTAGYFKYTDILELFTINFKRSKRSNYEFVRKIHSAFINFNPETIELNNYVLNNGQFLGDFTFKDHNYCGTTEMVNLIFKRAGNNPLESIKVLQEQLNLSLQQAKKVIDSGSQRILLKVDVDFAESIKYDIEQTGAVCYWEPSHYQTSCGSTITIEDGVLIFESSDRAIPKFYIPFVINKPTAMATDEFFAGDEYFLPSNSNLKIISVEQFHQKFILPFTKKIIENEVDTESI